MNIVFVSLDTLRASRLGCYGCEKPTSPYIDRIASQGVLFERAYASDIPTEAAHTGIFTGRLGIHTGIVSHGSALSYLPKGGAWMPELLRRKGFTTAAVDNLYQLKEWFARGYRYYMNSVGEHRHIDGRTVNSLAFPWIREHKEKSFFLFLHYWDAHTPYLPPKEYIESFYEAGRDPFDSSNRSMDQAYNHPAYPFFKHHHYDHLGPVTDSAYIDALYDAEVRYLDDRLRELDQCLIQEGLYENTLLVLFGDHGESLTEHGIYWDHCGLYETTVRVPVIMRWPGVISAGKRVTGLVQHVDLMPTVMEAAGLKLEEPIDGKSLWPVIRGEQEGTQERIYLSECAWQASRGIVTRDYKFIRTLDSGPYVRPVRELYALNADPEELVNLAVEMPVFADQLEHDLEQWVARELTGKQDPMRLQLEAGLPFQRRIDLILQQYGLSWEEWNADPKREIFDEAVEKSRYAGEVT
ncbi:sulfatase [Paenibacillus filicis]|uniref:Sulfatase n=1 Tax=Paenibacillus gyeongsangnamensis TaxID=3388067 RepID=A0ABT4QKK6_9BACL|nr:sulfatase [Paenibacillus filicis]MCZ8517379.1 sulfatase [Paenibacillus filicis]